MHCLTALRGLIKKQSVFDSLRQALSIALPNMTIEPTNDTGKDIDMGTIENRIMLFNDNLIKARGYHKSIACQKLIRQIDKYLGKLFCDPVKVSTTQGDTFIQPQ